MLLSRRLRWAALLFIFFIIIIHSCHKVSIQIVNVTLLIHQEFLIFIIWIFWFETFDLDTFQPLCLQLHGIIDVYTQVRILKVLAIHAHIWVKTISAWGPIWHSEVVTHRLWGFVGIIILLTWWSSIRLAELLRIWRLLHHLLICDTFLPRVWRCFLHLTQNIIEHIFWHYRRFILWLLYKLRIWKIMFIFTFFRWAQITDVVQSWWQIGFQILDWISQT